MHNLRNLSATAMAARALAGLIVCLLSQTLQAQLAPALSDCNAPAFAQTLRAAAQSEVPAAGAYWLSRNLIQWPGVREPGVYRIYYGAAESLVVNDGHPVASARGALLLTQVASRLPEDVRKRFAFVGPGAVLKLPVSAVPALPALLRDVLVLVHEDAAGHVLHASRMQIPGVLDDLYGDAAQKRGLGVQAGVRHTRFALWAPTAQSVSLCLYPRGDGDAARTVPMEFNGKSGAWTHTGPAALSGQYYTYLVDVVVPGVGLVRNRVTDPYSISLTTDSKRSYIADLNAPALKPPGWDTHRTPARVRTQTDMVVYELHVRDFSINDASVDVSMRGKYSAFTQRDSLGMRHLRRLSRAGLTDVHLLPVFDIATISEQGCTTPAVPPGLAPDSDLQQAAVMATAAQDCFNWGYDPLHFSAPEGSYASDAVDGAVRIREFRSMVMALHQAGLRVGMDVVYNHTSASGQLEKSVLDRIVPGYYHRLDSRGNVEHSTCCDNTATEHRMMAKLMIDSVALWATDYRIDSFRFDLMGHQPRAAMEQLQRRLLRDTGRTIPLIGEGWNFGEVANGARFVQAAQGALNGSGIATFSDRARDAARGGGAADSGAALVARQGYLNGMHYAPNALAPPASAVQLMQAADLVRVGLAGTLRDYTMTTFDGSVRRLDRIAYGDQPAGYASAPGEVVNYVENHDNHTLFDINALRLPQATSQEDRARVQILGAALPMFSQGIAYFHAGIDTLRSKSLDGNSFDSGDWFNRIDWGLQDNNFGVGLPPREGNGASYPWLAPVLANPAIKPRAQDIAWTTHAFADLLDIRASSSLFRLTTAREVRRRLQFPNTGPAQNPLVLVGHLRGEGHAGAVFRELLYFVNVDPHAQTVVLPDARLKPYVLHPVHLRANAADQRPVIESTYDTRTGSFSVPGRTALVYVLR